MFGPRISSVFTSRWKALAWSAGVLLTAYCTIPDAPSTEVAGTGAIEPAEPGQIIDTSEIERLTNELEELEKP